VKRTQVLQLRPDASASTALDDARAALRHLDRDFDGIFRYGILLTVIMLFVLYAICYQSIKEEAIRITGRGFPMEKLLSIVMAPIGLAWALAGPVTYILLVVDTWRGNASVIWKLFLCLTVDAFLAALWPLTWIFWGVQHYLGHDTPLHRRWLLWANLWHYQRSVR
jgi:hypothetical protein